MYSACTLGDVTKSCILTTSLYRSGQESRDWTGVQGLDRSPGTGQESRGCDIMKLKLLQVIIVSNLINKGLTLLILIM